MVLSNGSAAVFVCLLNTTMQMNALTLSASRRRDQVVILSALDLSAQLSTSRSERLSHALSQVWQRVLCKCTPGRIVRALFSAKVSTAVAFVCVTAMWWHNISIDSILEAQEAVAFDCLCAMPWGIVWTIRATVASFKEKGGNNARI